MKTITVRPKTVIWVDDFTVLTPDKTYSAMAINGYLRVFHHLDSYHDLDPSRFEVVQELS